jgi:hypothetical protein
MTGSRLAVAVTVGVVLCSSSAFAEPRAADKETARRLMADGRAERDQKDLKAALKSFMGADAIMQVPSTGIEVARTEVALGQLVEARDKALEITRSPVRPHEPTPYAEARTAAAQLGEELTQRIPTVKIVLSGAPSGAEVHVAIDGDNVPEAALVAPQAVDPGHHVVTAGVKGGTDKTSEIDVAERDAKTVSLDLSSSAPATQAGDAPVAPPETPSTSSGRASVPVLAWVGFIAGGASLAAGGVTGALALVKTNAAKGGCVDDRCPPTTFSNIDTANTMATISTVTFIAGGVLAAGGLVAFLTRGHAAPATPAARVEPWVGPAAMGVRGMF